MFPPRSIMRAGRSRRRKKVRYDRISQQHRTRYRGHTCASRITPRRSSIQRSCSTKLPSSWGSKQLVKQIRPFEGSIVLVVWSRVERVGQGPSVLGFIALLLINTPARSSGGLRYVHMRTTKLHMEPLQPINVRVCACQKCHLKRARLAAAFSIPKSNENEERGGRGDMVVVEYRGSLGARTQIEIKIA